MIRRIFVIILLMWSGHLVFAGVSSDTLQVEDSLCVKIICPSRWAMEERVYVKVIEQRKRYRVNKDGCIVITGCTPGNYTLEAEGKRIRKSTHKIEKRHFTNRDTVIFAIQPAWEFPNMFQINFAQHSFSPYWKQGGVSSVAVGFKIWLAAIYKKAGSDWRNTIDFQYGILKQGGFQFNKNIDQFEFNSMYNKHLSERWNYSTLCNIRTSVHNNYRINRDGSRGEYIGGFLSPGFMNLGTGINYKHPSPFFQIYYAPVNGKVTFVKDEELAYQFMPIEFEGQRLRLEFGSFLKVEVRHEVLKNVHVHTKADFFTSHLSGFGNIDVNWENTVTLRVNEYLSANFYTQLIYDDDILFDLVDKTGEPTGKKGPRTQFREAFNVGLTHRF